MGLEKITEFLQVTGLTKKDLALKCKINPNSFCTAFNKGKIGVFTADKLDYYTQGRIPYEALTDQPRPKKAMRRKGYKRAGENSG